MTKPNIFPIFFPSKSVDRRFWTTLKSPIDGLREICPVGREEGNKPNHLGKSRVGGGKDCVGSSSGAFDQVPKVLRDLESGCKSPEILDAPNPGD